MSHYQQLPPGVSDDASHRLLKRSLGPIDLILLGIGASIGSGIFVVTGVAAKETGPAVTLSFALAGLVSVVDALGYAELSSRFPGLVGGAYLYANAAFGELTAFVLFCHLMLDYHIGAASIARSLAGHLSSLLLQIAPGASYWLPACLSPSGMSLLGGYLSINLLAPVLLAGITVLLSQGVKESSLVNGGMTLVKIAIVLLVIVVGSTQVSPSNWVPFAPNGYNSIMASTSVVFFSYVGFDAVANTAEESKNPQRDIPLGIMASLAVCIVLYVGVSAVITGMLPYADLDPAAPLANAFAVKGLLFVGAIIDVGAIVGLTTTLLAGLYVQARLYMALGRDGLLPRFFSVVDKRFQTPLISQVWVGCVAAIMGALFNVASLSHILSVGVLVSYSLVCAAVVLLRLDGGRAWEATLAMCCTVALSFLLGIAIRVGCSAWLTLPLSAALLLTAVPLYTRHVYGQSPGFSMPFVPLLPMAGMAFNVYLIAQMHTEAWWRIFVVSVVALAVYAVYGRHHSKRRGVSKLAILSPSERTESNEVVEEAGDLGLAAS